MPFDVGSAPLANDFIRGNLQKMYRNGRKSKAFAVSPQGAGGIFVGQGSPEEAVRRGLVLGGSRAGVPCVSAAGHATFVVPNPPTLIVVSPLRATSKTFPTPVEREPIARR